MDSHSQNKELKAEQDPSVNTTEGEVKVSDKSTEKEEAKKDDKTEKPKEEKRNK